jgi:cold-inducible RNA-binding protein
MAEQKLFVGGLSFNTTNEGLRQFFTQAGTVVSANVVTDQMTGRSRGFGFVEMSTSEEAQQAVSLLNGRDLDGRSLKVEVAKPKGEGGGRRDDRGGRGGARGGGGRGGGGRGGWR